VIQKIVGSGILTETTGDLQPEIRKLIPHCTELLTRRETNLRIAASWALQSFSTASKST
jgi:hypothetical protein